MWRRSCDCCCHVASLFYWQKYFTFLYTIIVHYMLYDSKSLKCVTIKQSMHIITASPQPRYWREWRRPQRCTVLARAETRSGKGQEVEWGGFLSAAAVITSSGQDQDTSWWPIYHLSLAQLRRGSPKCCVYVPVFRIIVIISSTAATNCLQSRH